MRETINFTYQGREFTAHPLFRRFRNGDGGEGRLARYWWEDEIRGVAIMRQGRKISLRHNWCPGLQQAAWEAVENGECDD